MSSPNSKVLAIALNQIDADYKEGCEFIQSHEKNTGCEIADWEATHNKQLSAILNPFNDGWRGVVLTEGGELQYSDGFWG